MSRSFANEEAIFTEALARPPAERAAFLASACPDDPALLARLEDLLAAHDAPPGWLDEALPPPAPAGAETPGTRLGRYVLRARLGEGGCGTVHLADQLEPVRREVALKIVKLGMDTKEVIARFEAERQALALMDHPNIARVFDAGTTETGRPYFVMELAGGAPITRYCDEHRLLPEARLRLFVEVCRAVQHAHQKGIIHRDLKPSNIPVTLVDGTPVPKVIDFGIAKATRGRLTPLTIFTSVEQMLGTPAYMSPEQFLREGADVDTRSDVYSLGVVLYELLTGETPLDPETFARASWEERQRLIGEREPRRPSTCLRLLPPDRAAQVAARRSSEPARLLTRLRGDLDWIVMKCLEKDRARRYETAAALADDIQRHLHHEPVAASPPSRVYRLRKLIWRNQVAFAAAAAISLALILGAIASRWQAVRATRAEEEQHQLRERAEANARRALDEKRKVFSSRREADLRAYAAEMLLAHEAYREGKVTRALALLEKHRPPAGSTEDPRGFEWHHLWRLCHEGDALASIRAHDGPVSMVAFSRRGDVVSCDFAGQVRRHDPATGRRRNEFRVEGVAGASSPNLTDFLTQRTPRRLVLSPDGDWAASLPDSHWIQLWRTESPAETFCLALDEPPREVCFSPGAALLGVVLSTHVVVWDLPSRQMQDEAPRPETGLVSGFSQDGDTLLGRASLGAKLWSRRQGRQIASMPSAHTSYVTTLALSPRQPVVATGSWDTAIKLWDANNGRLLSPLVGHRGHVWCLAFSPDGLLLASGGGDETVRVWDVSRPAQARQVRQLRGHLTDVVTVAFSPDGSQLVSGDASGIVKIWPREERFSRTVLRRHDDWAFALAFSPTEPRQLASAGFSGRAWIWNLDDGGGRALSPARTYDYFNLVYSPDGRFVATGEGYWGGRLRQAADPPGTIRLWDAATGRELFHQPHDAAIAALPHHYPTGVTHPKMEARAPAISPDGRWLACGMNAGWIQIWQLPELIRTHHFLAAATMIQGLQFSPDGRWLAAVEGEGPTRVFATDTWREVACLGEDPNLGWGSPIAFSPDSTLLAFGSKRAWLWHTAKRDLLALPEGHDGPIMMMRFSPDGRTLATGSMDHTVKLWSLLSRLEVATLRGHTGPVSGLAFSADGTLLASSSQDHTIRLWRAAPPETRLPRAAGALTISPP